MEILDSGALRFGLKDGRSCISPIPGRPDFEQAPHADDVVQGDWTHLLSTHQRMDIVITPITAVTRWTGESMDYGTATDALLYRTHHAVNPIPTLSVSAETPN